jgi:predicted HAD superfamily Cof-like phosphohydrolase
MTTNFLKVRDFNISFGIGRSSTPDKKLFKLRWDLIKEESTELTDAIKNKDYVEILDAVSDILYVLYGAADSFEYEFDNYSTDIVKYIITGYSLALPQEIRNMTFDKARMEIIFNSDSQLSKLNLLVEKYQEELNKLENLFENEDIPSIIGQIDVLVNYMYVFAYLFGFDLNYTFDLVHSSNMSKLAESELIAEETVKWYLENEKRYDSPSYRLSPVKINDQPRWVIYNANTGKALKSIKYFPVNLAEYL